MHLVTVIPIKNGLPFEELTYYTKQDVASGDLISVPFRKDHIVAIVIDVKPLSEAKQSIKEATYGLRRIDGIVKKEIIPYDFIEVFQSISRETWRPSGHILSSLLDQDILCRTPTFYKGASSSTTTFIIKQHRDDRYSKYASISREHLAKGNSIAIITPTITDAKNIFQKLHKGIEGECCIYTSAQTDRQKSLALDRIISNKEPLVIIMTPGLLPWTRSDLGSIIIDREHSQYYYGFGSHGISSRQILETFASKTNTNIYLGSRVLSVETYSKAKDKQIEINQIPRWNDDPTLQVINMGEKINTQSPQLATATWRIIEKYRSGQKGHYFLYAQRKGMYPTTICKDCNHLIACVDCQKPLVLHSYSGKRMYICHSCDKSYNIGADDTLSCAVCGSWRLQTLGIATGTIEEELKNYGIPYIVIDGEQTKTRSRQLSAIKAWKEAESSVLIGTEMALNLIENVDGITVLSLDGLFSLPEYRTDERIFTLIEEMKDKVPDHGNIIIQTRLPHSRIWSILKSETPNSFYESELALRKNYKLPPVYLILRAKWHLIKESTRLNLKDNFPSDEIDWYEAGNGYTLAFIHVNHEEFLTNKSLQTLLQGSLCEAEVSVNPANLFN